MPSDVGFVQWAGPCWCIPAIVISLEGRSGLVSSEKFVWCSFWRELSVRGLMDRSTRFWCYEKCMVDMVIFISSFHMADGYIIYNVHMLLYMWANGGHIAFLNGFHVFNDGLFNTQTWVCSRSVGVESFHRARVWMPWMVKGDDRFSLGLNSDLFCQVRTCC